MRLYKITSQNTVEFVISELSPQINAHNIFADPNYRTGIMGRGVCGSPFHVTGSPFHVTGSPGGGAAAPALPVNFWNQWAFETIQAGAYNPTTLDGGRTVVGIFDTSPFSTTVGSPTLMGISAVPNSFNLTVKQPFVVPTISTHLSTPSSFDVKEHGLFVAGLVHGVAPESEIHLIRVLDDNGCGDLFRLARAIHDFIRQYSQQPELMQNVVINLSLGVAKPMELETPGMTWFDRSVENLTTVLLAAHQRGAVIAAAAGNDSHGSESRKEPHLPAAYPYVIGVAASNRENGLTCYSNRGDVMAPGGEAEFDGGACKIHTQECLLSPDPRNCPWGLVSLYEPTPPVYAYWVGTSFATPLVSGIAALGLQDNISQMQIVSALRTPGVICVEHLYNQPCPVP
jgi:subtilisin family serine protease